MLLLERQRRCEARCGFPSGEAERDVAALFHIMHYANCSMTNARKASRNYDPVSYPKLSKLSKIRQLKMDARGYDFPEIRMELFPATGLVQNMRAGVRRLVTRNS
jgi:hypothetical protein